MSSNKGKDGEMRVIKIVADIAIHEEGFDFTRPTITNESDMGADLLIKSTPQSLNRMLQVVAGVVQFTDEGNTKQSKKLIESRVDVKTTSNKLQTDTVEKFVADVRKHPKCTGHILMGGSSLTAPAQRKFEQYQQNFEQKGKVLAYVSNEGISRLESGYANSVIATLRD